MTDPRQIPFLIQLLDDDSPDVRETVFQQLTAFGPNLKGAVRKLPFKLNFKQRYYLDLIVQGQKRVRLRQMWPTWFGLIDESEKLEKALSILSDFLSTGLHNPSLTGMLNSLAFSYRVKYRHKDPRKLLDFLFGANGMEIHESDYENPQNCNLAYVIKRKRGIPISLATIYVLVARRLGMEPQEPSFVESFMDRMSYKEKMSFMESPGGGLHSDELQFQDDLVQEDFADDMTDIFAETVDAEAIVRLHLSSLVRAYQICDDENDQLVIELFKDLEFWADHRRMREITPEQIMARPQGRFGLGDVVVHNRYGYRAIVVAIDEECCATDEWYYGNQFQPERSQPWLHLLVDGSEQVTYVPQSYLQKEDEESLVKIEHPLLAYFFSSSDQGKYIRNENPWPETSF